MKVALVVAILLLALSLAVHAGDVIDLDLSTVSQTSEGEWFLEFYAPWCGHCQRFANDYEKVASLLKTKGVKVGRIDGAEHKAASFMFGVTAFPTIFHISNGQIRKYDAPRNVQSLVDFAVDRDHWMKREVILTSFFQNPYSIGGKFFGYIVQFAAVLHNLYDLVQEKTGFSHTVLLTASVLFTLVVGIAIGQLASYIIPPPARRNAAQRRNNNESSSSSSSASAAAGGVAAGGGDDKSKHD